MLINNLQGKKGLIIGIANEHSIAHGCAMAFHEAGADLAITYLNEKAEPYVRPIAEQLESPIIIPCDVRISGQLESVFERIGKDWGRLDFVLHSIAFAPRDDLQGRTVDCSEEGFGLAITVSCHSFIRVAQLAEPLMTDGGTLLTVTFYGSEKVVQDYNLMGPVKAALECSVRYMAAELGPKGIRVNSISPGPIKTRAASGINRFDERLEKAAERAPKRQLVTIEEVGAMATFLVSNSARSITGGVHYIDGGYNIVG